MSTTSNKLRFSEHQHHVRFRNRAEALPLRRERTTQYPDYRWVIKECRYMDNGLKDMRGNPHYHVCPRPFTKRKPH